MGSRSRSYEQKSEMLFRHPETSETPTAETATDGEQMTMEIPCVTYHGRSQDFERVGAPRGGCRISGLGTMEGPKAPSEARRREAPERRAGWGLGRGAVAPPQDGGPEHSPVNFLKFNSQICIFMHFFACLRR